MVKIFTTNENGNIELTKEELERLLSEAYQEGASSCWHNNYESIKVTEEKPKRNTLPGITWTTTSYPLENLNISTTGDTITYTLDTDLSNIVVG